MGKQATIILSYYTERWNEVDEIKQLLNYPADAHFETEVTALGNRAFNPGDLEFYIFSMKSWEESECLLFIDDLRKINWHFPDTVQVYFSPSVYKGNYELFHYVKLFNNQNHKP